MKRALDLLFAGMAILLGFIPFIVIALAVRFTSKGPVLYWSKRVGRDNVIFLMPKFRSMKVDTPEVATHLLAEPAAYITTVGAFLRKTSLDELPQLWCILCGNMSVVGPRPALYNQYDLIDLRTEFGVHKIRPGLTGWAQVNGRDELSVPEKVKLDVVYLTKNSFIFDIKIILMTACRVLKRDGIVH